MEAVVTLTAAQLRTILDEAVSAALARAGASTATDYLDAKGVAAMLQIHPRSVQKLVTRDGLPVHRLGPKTLRYRRSEVIAWEAARSDRPGSHRKPRRAA